MRRIVVSLVASLLGIGLPLPQPAGTPAGGLEAVPYARVRIADAFWSPRIDRNARVTLRSALDRTEESGNLANFRMAAGWEKGTPRGSHAYDSDVYKIIEGAAYSLRLQPDPELEDRIERLIDAIAAAQDADGYLNTYFLLRSPRLKWQMAPTEHELYCAGHLIEAGVAWAEATGRRTLLDVARRQADNVAAVFGPGRRYETSGHQEIELALVRLARATGERRYLELAKFFLDERGFAHGREHRLPTVEELARQDTVDPKDRRSIWSTRRYRQDHLPVVDQREAVGHAVRAGYMYAAMADIAATGDPGYLAAVRRLWDDVAGKKLYLSGAVGTAQFGDEGFGTPYNLPNEKAYGETCATVANVLWNHRMGLLEGDGKHFDVLELALYNGLLSGVSLSGDRFSYQNPLASRGGVPRDAWSDPACCPSNVVRSIPQIGGFVYARSADAIFVNLFVGSTVTVPLPGGVVRLAQTTAYPWSGKVRIMLEPEGTGEFSLNLRIPGWTGDRPAGTDLYRSTVAPGAGGTTASARVNGAPVPLAVERGYARIRRVWKEGDVVELALPMPVRLVRAHPGVEADRGRVALMRGPLLYCLESDDNAFDPWQFSLDRRSRITAERRDGMLGGITVLRGHGAAGGKAVSFQAVPYFVWGNRSPGAMVVWF